MTSAEVSGTSPPTVPLRRQLLIPPRQPLTSTIRPDIPTRRTSIRTANGSATTPAATILTTTSIIPGSTDALRVASAAGTSGTSPEVVPTASGSAVFISAWPRTTLAFAVTGSGTATTSSFTKILTTTAGTSRTT